MQRLIKGGERPAADINLIRANVTGKRAARIAAEQNLINARLGLGERLGLDYGQLQSIARASDPFPAFDGKPVLIGDVRPLVDKGIKNRLDLKAANMNLEALRVAVNSARDNLKPILGLTVGVNYVGNTLAENPLQVIGRKNGDAQLAATLNYTWDVVNNTSQGRLLTQSATYDQQVVATRALHLSIGTGVENAVAVYNRSAQQLVESQFTVELYTKTVENERAKLRLGSATLLDVVNVESQRIDAVLNHIAQRVAYATAIAGLRFQLGELITDETQTQVLPIERLKAYGRNEESAVF